MESVSLLAAVRSPGLRSPLRSLVMAAPIIVTVVSFFHFTVIRGEYLSPAIAFTSVRSQRNRSCPQMTDLFLTVVRFQ